MSRCCLPAPGKGTWHSCFPRLEAQCGLEARRFGEPSELFCLQTVLGTQDLYNPQELFTPRCFVQVLYSNGRSESPSRDQGCSISPGSREVAYLSSPPAPPDTNHTVGRWCCTASRRRAGWSCTGSRCGDAPGTGSRPPPWALGWRQEAVTGGAPGHPIHGSEPNSRNTWTPRMGVVHHCVPQLWEIPLTPNAKHSKGGFYCGKWNCSQNST